MEPSVMPPSVLEAPDVDVAALVCEEEDCDEDDVDPFTSPSVVSGTEELSVRSLL